MELPQKKIQSPASLPDLSLSVLGGVCCVLAFAVLCVEVTARPFNFDESLHAHFLWLTSVGRVPHKDFWCNYPALGYVIILPYFRLLPESFLSFLPLRILGVCFLAGVWAVFCNHARQLGSHWFWGGMSLAVLLITPEVADLTAQFRTDACAAVLAISALAVMFREPTAWRSGLSAGLSVLSVLVMPKYAYPLILANLAYLGFGCFMQKSKSRGILAGASIGLIGGLAMAQLLLWTVGVGLVNDLYWSTIFMRKFYVHCSQTDKTLQPQLSYVLTCLAHDWWIAVILVTGIQGWLLVELKKKSVRLWVGTAVIAGVSWFWATCPFPYPQYFVPGLFCLALFIPYAGALLKTPMLKAGGVLLLTIVIVQGGYRCTRVASAEIASGVLTGDMYARQTLLNLIPRSEKVVGLAPLHPCFRQDQTFVTWDEHFGDPQGFTPLLPKDSTEAEYFRPEHLTESIEHSPPAAISLQQHGYPPGWDQVLINFLIHHSRQYRKVKIVNLELFIRADLLNTAPKSVEVSEIPQTSS